MDDAQNAEADEPKDQINPKMWGKTYLQISGKGGEKETKNEFENFHGVSPKS